MVTEFILLLTQFGGGPGDPANNVVRFLLATFFWGVLFLVSYRMWRDTADRRHLYFSISATVGASRELFMFTAEYGSFRGYISFPAIFRYYPPLEHTAAIFSIILMGYAFLRFYFSFERFSRLFLICSSLLTLTTYLIVAPLWLRFLDITSRSSLHDDLFIGAQFHDFPGDLIFRIVGAIVSLTILGAFLYAKNQSIRFPLLAFIAFFSFFIDDTLQAVNDLCNDRYAPVFAPIRHCLHICAITQFVGGYWWEITRQLKNREQFLQTMLDAIPDMLFYKDTQSVYLGCNQNFAAGFIGKPKDRIIGCHEAELMPDPDLAELFLQTDLESMATDTSHIYELPHTLPDGSQVILETIKTPFHDADGKIAGLIGVSRDITVRKQTEEMLRDSQRQLKAHIFALEQSQANSQENLEKLTIVANGIPMLIAHVDKKQRYLYVNRAYADWVGRPEDQIIGKTVQEIMPKETYDVSISSIENVLRGTPCFLERAVIIRGEVRIHSVSFIPQKNEQGDIRAYFGLVTDITEQRNLKEQLRHSQKMDAIGQLAGGVAHDFNNILTVITGYCELMHRDVAEDNPLRINIERVHAAAERATQLTQSLLAFSRKQPMTLQVFDLNSTLVNVEKFLRRIIGEDIQLAIRMADKPLTISADNNQIEQVMMNLATNARDAMPAGGSLTLSLQRHEIDNAFVQAHGYGSPGEYALLTAMDTGSGMNEETRKRIFEPFFTTKEGGKGTGLGLAIVYGIVKQHNGFITVYSEPDKGTAFRIFIPLHAQATVPEEKAIPLLSPKGVETILVAEDDASVRGVIVATLENSGYTIIQAEDGQDAVDKFTLNRDTIRLVFMDLIMPDLNGRDAAEQIRLIQPHTRILFTSGYPTDTIHGGLDAGAEFLIKPVKPTELLWKTREMLDRPYPLPE